MFSQYVLPGAACVTVTAVLSAGLVPVSAQPRGGAPSQNQERPAEFAAEVLFPLAPGELTYRIIEGENEGELATATMREGRNGVWIHETEGVRIEFLQQTADGDIVLVREDIPSEGYSFRYDPPPVILPAVVRPGLEHRQRGEVRVYEIENDHAEHAHTTEYEHTLRVKGVRLVPANDGARMRAIVISTNRGADLQNASVETEIDNAYFPEVGRIYQRAETRVQGGPLNLWSETNVHTMRYSDENRPDHQQEQQRNQRNRGNQGNQQNQREIEWR